MTAGHFRRPFEPFEASLRFYVDQLAFTVPGRYEEEGRARVAVAALDALRAEALSPRRSRQGRLSE